MSKGPLAEQWLWAVRGPWVRGLERAWAGAVDHAGWFCAGAGAEAGAGSGSAAAWAGEAGTWVETESETKVTAAASVQLFGAPGRFGEARRRCAGAWWEWRPGTIQRTPGKSPRVTGSLESEELPPGSHHGRLPPCQDCRNSGRCPRGSEAGSEARSGSGGLGGPLSFDEATCVRRRWGCKATACEGWGSCASDC